MIKVQLMKDEIYINCQNFSADISSKIKEHSDSSDWMIAFANGQPYEDTKFEIEDFEIFLPKSKDDRENIVKTAISMHKALRKLPGHIIGDVRFWAWMTFTKMYKFFTILNTPTKEAVESMVVPKAITTRRATMLQSVGRFYFMCDVAFDVSAKDPYYLASYIIDSMEVYRNLVYRNLSDIPSVSRSVIKAQKEYEEAHHGTLITTDHTRMLMKDITSIGSVRLIDAIPEDELYLMVQEKLDKIMSAPTEE